MYSSSSFPSATVRLCFHRCLSVHRGRCTPTPPPRADTPWQAYTPLAGRHPPGRQTPPPCRQTLPPAEGYCSGRYASYWNAFFFVRMLSYPVSDLVVLWKVSFWWHLLPPWYLTTLLSFIYLGLIWLIGTKSPSIWLRPLLVLKFFEIWIWLLDKYTTVIKKNLTLTLYQQSWHYTNQCHL